MLGKRSRPAHILGPAVMLVLTACQGAPELGDGGSAVSGSAGAAGTQDETHQLVKCQVPLGTAALVEPESNSAALLQSVGLQSPTPLLRLLMAQSNCFRVIDRGAALANIQTEQTLKQSGMLQSGATTARGRMVTVQWLITPNVVFSNPNAGGFGALGALGGFLGPGGAIIGALAGSIKIQEAQTTLFLTDAQTGEQTGVSEGAAKVTDFGGGAGLGGFGGGIAGLGAVGGYGNTAEGKLIAAAYLDAFNKLVAHIRATTPNLPTVTGEEPAAVSGPRVAADAVPTAGQSFLPLVRVNIRGAPDRSGAVVTTVAPGTVLVAAGDHQDGWFLVTMSGGAKGWVLARNLTAAR
ncbi:MAG: CsgG/HfaB family protein [Novosphingobium sp.]